MSDEKWNRDIKLFPHDYLFKWVVEPWVPRWLHPNMVTVLRMLLTPFVLLFLAQDNYRIGVPFFLFVALTDAFDGSLARVRKQITEWGILYDPIADKMLIGSVLLVIVLRHINFYLGAGLIAVEAIMLAGGWYYRVRGRVEPAGGWGKLKMITEVIGILILLASLWFDVDLLVDISNGTLALALVFAILSILVRIK